MLTLGVGIYGFEFHWVHMILNFEYPPAIALYAGKYRIVALHI